MTARIALLRGVNVGGSKKFPIARQREIMEGLGFGRVTVYLQSGNIVFDDPEETEAPEETARRIEQRFAAEMGFEVPVLIRTREDLATAVAANPFPEAAAEPKTLHVVFLSAIPVDTAGLDALDQAAFEPERFRLIGRELYLWLPGGMGRSKLAERVLRTRMGVIATARNWNTVSRLLALAEEV